MLEVDAFALVPLAGTASQSALLQRGKPTGLIVDGIVLKKQFQLGKNHLLLLTEDCPYEELLSIYLINDDSQILDAVELGVIYAPGILKTLDSGLENKLTFSFFGEERWCLEVLDRPVWRCNRPMHPVQYKRSFIAPRRLILTKFG